MVFKSKIYIIIEFREVPKANELRMVKEWNGVSSTIGGQRRCSGLKV